MILDINNLQNLKRPSFDQYFLQIALFVSLRSDDEFAKHGAIIVDNLSKHPIGTGYNGTFRKSNKLIEGKDRDSRRPYMIHAEENAIMNSSVNPLSLTNGATIYITGLCCINCLQRVINFGITKIVELDKEGTSTENDETEEIRQNILSNSNIKIEKIPIEDLFLICPSVKPVKNT